MNKIITEAVYQLSKRKIPVDVIQLIMEYVAHEENVMNQHYKNAALTAAETATFGKGMIHYDKCPLCGGEYEQYGFVNCYGCKLYVCIGCQYDFCDECYDVCVCRTCYSLGKRFPANRSVNSMCLSCENNENEQEVSVDFEVRT